MRGLDKKNWMMKLASNYLSKWFLCCPTVPHLQVTQVDLLQVPQALAPGQLAIKREGQWSHGKNQGYRWETISEGHKNSVQNAKQFQSFPEATRSWAKFFWVRYTPANIENKNLEECLSKNQTKYKQKMNGLGKKVNNFKIQLVNDRCKKSNNGGRKPNLSWVYPYF